MQAIVLLTFCIVCVADFTPLNHVVPWVKFVPELMSLLIAPAVIFEAMRKGVVISARYWAIFAFLCVVILCGILTNEVGPGPTLAGFRYYLRAMPLFLVPAVFQFTDKQIRQQLKFVLAIGLLQLPIALYQRWTVYSEARFSGDDVRGTLGESGTLSIILICVAVVLTGFFVKKLIPWRRLLVVFFPLLLPTTINETKATVILLPLGLLTTLIAAAPRGKRVSVFVGGVALLVGFGFVLIPVYNLMNANSPFKGDKSLLGFFTDEKQLETYLEGKRPVAIGERRAASRGDSIKVPLQYLSRDPVHFAFGLGLGNATHSSIGKDYTGSYYDLLGHFAITSFSVFLLEIGVLGTVFVFLLYAMIALDALAVAKMDAGQTGAVAAGWIGVVAIMAASTFYVPIHVYAGVSYLFWYFSGVVAARRAELALAQQTSSPRGRLPRATA